MRFAVGDRVTTPQGGGVVLWCWPRTHWVDAIYTVQLDRAIKSRKRSVFYEMELVTGKSARGDFSRRV